MEYYIGMSLSPASTIETGVVVLDENNTLILVDKLFSMNDVQFFFDNFSSLKNSKVCVSLPWNNMLMTGKWRILSKPYQLVQANSSFLTNITTFSYSIRDKRQKNMLYFYRNAQTTL